MKDARNSLDITENTRDISLNARDVAENARNIAENARDINSNLRLIQSTRGAVGNLFLLVVGLAIGIGIILALPGCGGSVSYGAPYIALEPPPHRRGVRVQGNDCTYQSALGNVRDVSVRTAMEHALEGTGSTALVDVEITTTDPPEFCIEVEGVTVR